MSTILGPISDEYLRRREDREARETQARPVILIMMVRWARGAEKGSTVVSSTARPSGLDPYAELRRAGVAPGFVVETYHLMTRTTLDALPLDTRRNHRHYYAELIRAERSAAGLRPFDAVDLDCALDSWSLGYRVSRD